MAPGGFALLKFSGIQTPCISCFPRLILTSSFCAAMSADRDKEDDIHPKGVRRFVRKGLEGHGVVPARDGTPAKPGFLRLAAKNAPKFSKIFVM
jgi:hypothetical protein